MKRIRKRILMATPLQWIKLTVVAILYILFTVWDGNYWLLAGLSLVFDIYISRVIPWGIWKQSENSMLRKTMEWVDAVVFALIAVYFIHIFAFQQYEIPTSSLEKTLLVGDYLFVSKINYGPRLPNTPLAFPLVHNTFPVINAKSYFDHPYWNYKRLKGLDKVKRGDIVVFNCPTEISRPVDRKENYIKRCVGMPGDSLQIISKTVYCNGKALPIPKYVQFNYFIETKGELLSERQFGELGVSKEDQLLCNRFANISSIFSLLGIKPDENGNFNPVYRIPLTQEALIFLKRSGWVKSVCIEPEDLERMLGGSVYPNECNMGWTRDNFGPIWIPKKGATIVLNKKNLALYKRCIVDYERNTLLQEGNKIFINKRKTNTYTFNYDYYFMMGDNRHNSSDSRMWGFVPEDHIVGKPLLILMSIDKDRSWREGKIRWNRVFRFIKNQ